MKFRLILTMLVSLLATTAFATDFTDLPADFVPNSQVIDQNQPARTMAKDLTFYSDENDFLAVFPNLTYEGFDNTLVGVGEFMGCEGMISSTSDDECYEPGAIAEGIAIGPLPEGALYAVIGEQAFGNFTPWIGPNAFEDAMVARFLPPVSAFGSMFMMAMVSANVTMDVYGPSGLIGSETIFAGINSFWGVSSSSEMITEIIFTAELGEPKLVDYVYFGDGQTVSVEETSWDMVKSIYQ